MVEQNPSRDISRRTIAKGAAWTAPAITLAASAPSLAASPAVCTDCVTEVANASATAVPTTVLTGATASNVTTTVAGGLAAILTCSWIVSLGIPIATGARLTMSGRRGAVNTPTTYEASGGLGVGVAGGALGATAVTFPSAFTFPGTSYPNGLYLGLGPVDGSPIRPQRLCIDFTVPLEFGIDGETVDCPFTACYTPTFATATVGSVASNEVVTGIVYGTLWGPA